MDYLTWIAIKTQLWSLPVVHAQQGTTFKSFNLKDLNPFSQCNDMVCIAQSIFKGARIISVPIVIILVFYGAFVLMTSAGSPERVKQGRQIIMWAIVGFLIIITAEGITTLVANSISNSSAGACPGNPGCPSSP